MGTGNSPVSGTALRWTKVERDGGMERQAWREDRGEIGKRRGELVHVITRGRGAGGREVQIEDIKTCILGINLASAHSPPRTERYTHVYTIVYTRVHNSVHTSTQPRSKYHLCRALLYVRSRGIKARCRRLRLRNDQLRAPKSGGCGESGRCPDGMEIGQALGFSVSLCGIMPFAPIHPLD